MMLVVTDNVRKYKSTADIRGDFMLYEALFKLYFEEYLNQQQTSRGVQQESGRTFERAAKDAAD